MQQQFAALAQAFQRAGLRPDAAREIAYLLGNPQQEVLSGPQKTDTTPRNMRQVRPDDRRHSLQNLDFRDADQDYRKQRTPMTEERVRPAPPDAVRQQFSAQQTQDSFNVNSGSYTDARPSGGSVQVGLRVRGADQAVATLDGASNAIVGKRIRAETDASGLRFFVEETGQELVWKLQFFSDSSNGTIDVVTGIELTGEGLTVTTTPIFVLRSDDPKRTSIPTTSCQQ